MVEMNVDLEEIKRVVKSNDFADFLLSHTVNFSSAAFILDTLFKKIDELETQE